MAISIATQGLAGLVIILSIALWRTSSQQAVKKENVKHSKNAVKKGSSHKKKNKKKSDGSKLQPVSHNNAQGTQKSPSVATKSSEVEKVSVPRVSEPLLDRSLLEKSEKVSIPEDDGQASENQQTASPRKGEDQRTESINKGATAVSPSVPETSFSRDWTNGQDSSLNDEDGGWQDVTNSKSRVQLNTTASPSTFKDSHNVSATNAWANKNPFAVLPDGAVGSEKSRTISLTTSPNSSKTNAKGAASATSSSAPTKRQRQNAARTQAKKAEREAAEANRIDRLAQHRRGLQAERSKAADTRRTIASVAPKSSEIAKTSFASINEKGSLVWD